MLMNKELFARPNFVPFDSLLPEEQSPRIFSLTRIATMLMSEHAVSYLAIFDGASFYRG